MPSRQITQFPLRVERSIVHNYCRSFFNRFDEAFSKPFNEELAVSILRIAKRSNMLYVAVLSLKSGGNYICPLISSAALCVLDFDTAHRPTVLSDKALVYTAFVHVDTLFYGDFL